MNLSGVKWRRCEKCKRSMPLAHVAQASKKDNAEKKARASTYKAHKNMRCSPCMRKELAALKKIDRPYDDEKKRIKLLMRMLP